MPSPHRNVNSGRCRVPYHRTFLLHSMLNRRPARVRRIDAASLRNLPVVRGSPDPARRSTEGLPNVPTNQTSSHNAIIQKSPEFCPKTIISALKTPLRWVRFAETHVLASTDPWTTAQSRHPVAPSCPAVSSFSSYNRANSTPPTTPCPVKLSITDRPACSPPRRGYRGGCSTSITDTSAAPTCLRRKALATSLAAKDQPPGSSVVGSQYADRLVRLGIPELLRRTKRNSSPAVAIRATVLGSGTASRNCDGSRAVLLMRTSSIKP